MQFETLPALTGQVPTAGRVLRRRRSQPGSMFNDPNFRNAKKCFDIIGVIGRLFLAQVNVAAPSDPSHRIPANGGDAQAPGPAMSTVNFGVN